MAQSFQHVVVGQEGCGKDTSAYAESVVNPLQSRGPALSPGRMSILLSSAWPEILPSSGSRPPSPDYFSFAASFRSQGGILGSDSIASDSLAFPSSKSSINHCQSHNYGQFSYCPPLDLKRAAFPSYLYASSTSSDSPGSYSERLTYSPLSPPTPALASSNDFSAAPKTFLTNEELLFLSPQQSQIIQEAHYEARRRASLPEQGSVWSSTTQTYSQKPFFDTTPASSVYNPMDACVPLPMAYIPVDQASSSDGFRLLSKHSYDVNRNEAAKEAASAVDQQELVPQYHSATTRIIKPIPIRPNLAQVLEETSGEEPAVAELPEQTSPSAFEDVGVEPTQSSFTGTECLGTTTPSQSSTPAVTSSSQNEVRPSTSERAPSANAFRNSANAKIKQLGTCPADEAFAGSLDDLKSCGQDKPPYLWWTLIRAALLGSSKGKLQMETLCAVIMEKFPYFGTAKEAKNWKSSIRSVIHTKPCFIKTETKDKVVWWSVDVNIDPREQRRGLKKRSLSTSSAGGNSRRPAFFKEDVDKLAKEVEEEDEDDLLEEETKNGCPSSPSDGPRKRRRTN